MPKAKKICIKFSRNDKLLFIACFMITALIVFRDVFNFPINKFVLLSVCAVAMPFLTLSNFLCFICFISPLSFGLPSTYIYLLAVVVYIFKKKKIDTVAFLLFILYFVLEIFLAIAYDTTYEYAEYVGYFSRLFFLFTFIREELAEIDCTRIIKFFIIGVLIFAVIIALMYLQYNSLGDVISGKVRLGNTSSYLYGSYGEGVRMSTNANNVAYFCVVGMACCLSLLYKEKKNYWLLVFLAILLCGSLTVSRTYLLVSGLLCIVLISITMAGKFGVGKKAILLIAIICGIFVFLNTGILDALLNRFGQSNILMQDSRTSIFLAYMEAFFDKPLAVILGTGAFTHRKVLFPTQSTHNGLQQILVSYGAFGFFIFIISCMTPIIRKVKLINDERAVKFMSLLPMITAVLFTQTIQFLNPSDLMLPFIISVFAITKKQEKDISIENKGIIGNDIN